MHAAHARKSPVIASALICAAAFAFENTAHAQWQVTNLHPSGSGSSASGTSGGQQVGSVNVGSVQRASL